MIRPAAVAGTWYPGTALELAAGVDAHLARTTRDVEGELVALIAPHAGLMYSGPVAAHAYRLLAGRSFNVAVIVGPSHFVGFDGVAVYPSGGFDTPLGVMPIADDCAAALRRASPMVREHPPAHVREHSIEMQLPFLRRLAPGLPIVPLVMGRQTAATARALGDALQTVLRGRRALLVASTDLSHYHGATEAARLDSIVIDHVSRLDADGLQAALDACPEHACGGGPMVAVMRAARLLGAREAVVLQYGNSGDVSGDKSAVVGYLAAALGAFMTTSEAGRSLLFRIAREAIEAHVNSRQSAVGSRQSAVGSPQSAVGSPQSAVDSRSAGVFVTIYHAGEPRGCIGHIEADQPLPVSVARCAVAACSEDPRFPAVTASELPEIWVEISVLGPMEPAAGPSDVEGGRHGLMVEMGRLRGLLLPQVATERQWNAVMFLSQTCRKAGLARDSWRHGATVWRFEAEVFGDGGAH